MHTRVVVSGFTSRNRAPGVHLGDRTKNDVLYPNTPVEFAIGTAVADGLRRTFSAV